MNQPSKPPECTHDVAKLTVTGRERTDGKLTWVLVVCQCGEMWPLVAARVEVAP